MIEFRASVRKLEIEYLDWILSSSISMWQAVFIGFKLFSKYESSQSSSLSLFSNATKI